MATIEFNTEWDDKPEVQKGDYGELLVRQCLEGMGFIIYSPTTMRAHPIDMFACKGSRVWFAVEVKTKAMCNKYPEIGIDYSQYERYMRFSEENELPVLMVFVDEDRREIYGNYLHKLDSSIRYKGMDYPKTIRYSTGAVRYFPECHMRTLRALTAPETAILKKFKVKQNTGDDWLEQGISFGKAHSRY